MRHYKLQMVGILVLVSLFFSLTGIFAAPAYATTSLSIETGPQPTDPAVCREDVTATVAWMNKFTLTVLDDVSGSGFTHVHGGAYIGRNYSSGASSVFGQNASLTCSDNALTIVGTISNNSSFSIQTGNARFGQAVPSSGLTMNSGCSATQDNTLSNTAIKADMLSASNSYAAATANNNDPTVDNSGKLIFAVNTVTANGLAIFNVTTAEVFGTSPNNPNNQIEFVYGPGITPSTTTILVNLSGTSMNWTNNASFGSSVQNNAARIIWNFYQATSISIPKQWYGAMLAPLASLNANSQNLTGSIVVKNLTSAGEIHDPNFLTNNTTPLKDVCENPPDYTIPGNPMCADLQAALTDDLGGWTYGNLNQFKVDVESDGPPYASWEYNPVVGSTTNGTAPYIGGSTAAGQSYPIPLFGSIAISTTDSAGNIIAYTNGAGQDDMRTNWTSTFGIDFVLVKATNNATVYVYSPEAYSDYLLESPNASSISHVTFCWDSTVTPVPGISIKKYTNGQDADTVTGPIVPVGSTVTWTYIVTNTGDVALNTIVVTDNIAGVTPVYISGDTNSNNQLDTNETWTYSTTGIATAGQYANIGTVTGKSPEQVNVTDNDPSHYFGSNPGISIKKYTNGQDADVATGPVVPVGSTVTWTYIVTNTGNVPLSTIVVTDNIAGVTPVYVSGDTNSNSKLDTNETWTYSTTGIATAGQYANIGTVTGKSPTEQPVTDNDPSHYFGSNPGISIKKYTNGEDADTVTGPVVPVGSTVTWTYIVTNTGNVPLSNVVVTDNIAGVTPVYVNGDTNSNSKLDTTETWTYSTTGIATAGQYANIGTVTGKSPTEQPVTDNDPSHYFGSGPGISIKKYTNGEDADTATGPIVPVGSTVTWTYIVTNPGNVALNTVVVTDNIAGVTPVYISGDTNSNSQLDTNETWTYSTTGIATAGQYANIGTVTGKSPEQVVVTDNDPSHYFGSNPGISIKKYTNGEDADTATGPIVPVGSTVTWTYIVTNTGNVPINTVVVTDNIAGVTPVYVSGDLDTDGKLDTNETWTYSATGIAIAGQYGNVGTVTGKSPVDQPVTDNDPSHYFGANPGISIKKYTNGEDADVETGPVVPVGSTVTWTYIVTNTGNVPLSSVVVTDNIAGVTPVYISGDFNTDGKLDLTETWTFSTTGTAIAGQYANIGTVTGKSLTEQPVTDNDPSHYFGSTPTQPELASLGDRVWHDLNANGVQDDGEPGFSNVTVTLFEGDCTTATGLSTTTNGSGIYGFGDLEAGSYCVKFTVPAGYTVSPQNVGNDSTDSDGNSTGQTVSVTLAAGDNNPTIDLGLYQLASLGDRVWIDANENGMQDDGEENVADVTVTLFNSSNVQVGNSMTTDSNGNYLFTGLVPGSYYVIFNPLTLPEGYSFTTANANGVADDKDSDANTTTGQTPAVTLASGDNYLDLDAGLVQQTEPPVEPLLSALGDTVWFDANKNGIQDALGTPDGEKGVAGVEVNLYTSAAVFVATEITDADGKYLFTDLQPGSYYVEFATVEGYSFTHYTVGSSETDSNALVPWVDVTISTGDVEAELGEPLTYTLLYTNTDATREATKVVISTTVPAGTTYAGDAANPGWQCSTPNAGGVCTLTIDTVAANTHGSVTFTVTLDEDGENVPDQLDIFVSITQGTLARTDVVTLAAGETNLTVDAGLVTIESSATTPTPTAPTNLPDDGQPQQRQYIFLPAVQS